MRAFIAIDIDQEIRQRLIKFVAQIRENAPEVRWTTPESWHLTLKFLGETDDSTIARIKRALSQLPFPSFSIEVSTLGFFPSRKLATVLWAGVSGGNQLKELVGLIESITADMGLERERHRYSPHLTLARANRKGNDQPFRKLQQAIPADGKDNFGTMTAREYFLYESKLSPKGAHYRKIAGFQLK